MSSSTLNSPPRIRLLGINAELRSIFEAETDAFEGTYQAHLGDCGDLARDVTIQTLALLHREPRAAPWGGYLTVNDAGMVVGTCGFKTGPSAAGTIEIAYFTFPPFESQGFATAAAHALIHLAKESSAVQIVIAHTLPERNVSARILERLGFEHAGVVNDPDDGEVWRWELPVNEAV